MTCRDGRSSGGRHSNAAGRPAPSQAAATAEDALPELKRFGSTLPKTQQPNEEDAAYAPPPQPPAQAESPVAPAKQHPQQLQQQGAEPLAAQEAGAKSIERCASGGRRLTPFPRDLASADGGLCGEQNGSKAVTSQPEELGSRQATSDSPDGPAEGQPPALEAGLTGSSMDVSTAGAEALPHQTLGKAGTAADGGLTTGRPRASSAADDPFSTGRRSQLASQTAATHAAAAAADQPADADMEPAAAAQDREDPAFVLPPNGEEAAAIDMVQGAGATELTMPGPAPPPTLPFYRCSSFSPSSCRCAADETWFVGHFCGPGWPLMLSWFQQGIAQAERRC